MNTRSERPNEGESNVLRRCYGLARCSERDESRDRRWVGCGIVMVNLATIAPTGAQFHLTC